MKFMMLMIVILIAGWSFAMWNPFGEESELPANTFQVGNYTFYEELDGTYSIFARIEDNEINYVELPKDATTKFVFRADPRNVSEIYLDATAAAKVISSKKIYLAFNPNQPDLGQMGIATYEVARITAEVYRIQTISVFTEDAVPPDPNVPLRTCADATNTTTVITFEITNTTTKVYSAGNCVYVQGADADGLILAADRLGMALVNILL